MKNTSTAVKLSVGSQPSGSSIGILLPEFKTLGYPISSFSEAFLGGRISTEASKVLLLMAKSHFVQSRNYKRRMVMVEGRSLKKDPHADEVRKFADGRGWITPSIENTLYQIKVISVDDLSKAEVEWAMFMHEPVNGCVLGVAAENEKKVIIARTINPKRGLFARNGAFAFDFDE